MSQVLPNDLEPVLWVDGRPVPNEEVLRAAQVIHARLIMAQQKLNAAKRPRKRSKRAAQGGEAGGPSS